MNRPRFRIAPKVPEIRMPTNRRSPIEIALARFIAEVPWAAEHDGRAIIKILQPKAEKARRARGAMIARKIDTPQAFALPKEATPQAIKGDLHDELEALCKKIVFTRDCGHPDSRTGECISCRGWFTNLQWGHFIPQNVCKWLQYDPRATGGQCPHCNGFKQGNYAGYAAGIERRQPGLVAILEAEHAAHLKFSAKVDDLEKKKKELEKIWESMQSGRSA